MRVASARSTVPIRPIGEVGRVESVEEVRIETVCPRALRGDVVAAMVAAHPYEEPAYDVVAAGPDR